MTRAFRTLGPGLLLAATSIGGSHLVLAPTAGARFGYELLWLVIVAHVLKYHAFEFGPRLALAADMSLLEGYKKLPGPRGWALWVGATDMVLESVGVLAAVAGLTGAILAAGTGTLSVPAWTAVVVVVAGLMLRLGRYRLLTIASGLMLLGLLVGTAIAFASTPPSAHDWWVGLTPHYPAGSLVLVGALLGWMPTGVGVSIWHSLWMREDRRFAAEPDRRVRLARGLWDMRFGYAVSAVAGIFFLALGAEVLRPQGLVPEGVDTALTLSRIYTDRLGGWMQPVFLVVACFAMFSTTYAVMDGMPRTLTAAWRHLRDEPDADRADRGRMYWIYLMSMTVGSLAVVALVPDPVALITVLAAVTFVFSPLYFVLNTWCVTHLIEDPALRPSRADLAVAAVGIVFMVMTAVLVLYTEIGVRVLGWG